MGLFGGASARRFCLLFAAVIGSMLLVAPAMAQITGQPQDITVFAGDNATFTVTAPGGWDPRWAADEGSGFNTLLDNAVYSGSRTNTLTVNAVTPSMNGYKFYVWIRVGPDIQSNTATLTVQIPVPEVTSVAVPSNATYIVGQNIDFTVYFDHRVLVAGTPQINLTVGATSRAASYVSGSGTNTLVFRYTVQAGDQDADGITVGSLSGGAIKDNATNSADAVLTLNSVGSTAMVLVDGIAPTVTSTAPVSGAAAADTSVDFDVAFSETVAGIATSGFSLGRVGTANGTISAVSATSGSSVRVTVNAITGNGTLKLNMNSSSGVTDSAGNVLGSAFTSGSTHTVAIPTAPGAPSINSVTASDQSVAVAFSPPASNGGSAITGYTVTSSPDNVVAGGNGVLTSPITVNGLSNGTAYTFTVTATNAIGTSTTSTPSASVIPRTVPTAPVITGVTGGDRQVAVHFTAPADDGGDAVTSYTVTSSPDGVTETGTSSPITVTGLDNGKAYTFTVTASNGAGPGGVSTPSSSVTPTNVPLVFSPNGGQLLSAMAGEDYSQTLSATGGVGTLIYSLFSGSLPDGLILNISTGALTGPLTATAEVKDYAFTIQVKDGNNATSTASYTISVVEQKVTVANRSVTVAAGATPTNVNLTTGATGGPFTSADIVEVSPPNAGNASIVNGEFAQAGGGGTTGWYLKFIPNPTYSGQASVRFRLTSALGVSNTGIVTYVLGYDPAEVAVRMDTMVRGFVQTRQNLIASNLGTPGLVERRQLQQALDPVTSRLSPSIDGLNAYFATSLAQVSAAAKQADGVTDTELALFNVWLEGTFLLHNRPQNDNRWGSFGMISAGADYLVSEKVLLGLSFHYDRMSDPTNADATLTGNGWLAGPYASFELGDGVFWDTNLLYGGSSNDIDTAFWDGSFDTRRWLFDTAIEGQWQLDAMTVISPKLRTVYLSETVEDYAVENGSGDILDIGGFTTEQLRVSLGADLARRLILENGAALTPSIGLTGGFSGLDGSGAFGQAAAGLSLDTLENWSVDFGLLFNIEGNGQTSTGIKIGVGGRL